MPTFYEGSRMSKKENLSIVCLNGSLIFIENIISALQISKVEIGFNNAIFRYAKYIKQENDR